MQLCIRNSYYKRNQGMHLHSQQAFKGGTSMPEITNADIIKTWANAPRKSIESHGDEGDFARQALLNPAIFTLLGNDIQGKKILDAGCGQGYLCRLLAKRGAIVTGVEPSENWYRYALEREQAEHLGIT